MAIDTARINLELASGRNQVTAPFRHAVHRQRKNAEGAAPADATAQPPVAAQLIVDVPLAPAAFRGASSGKRPGADRPGAARPPWIAFVAAILVVAAAVWWIMLQRLPDIDPREVIERNLVEAQQAMADARYTDPPQRSALHYYSTVLALQPDNADAIAGIDAIADRHIADARVLLDGERIAEAGVALNQARRARPNHSGLASLDTQLRIELRKMLAASTVAIPRAAEKSSAKPLLAKATTDASSASRPASIRQNGEVAKLRQTAPPSSMTAAPKAAAQELPTPLPITLDESALERIALAKETQAARTTAAVHSATAGTSASHDHSPGVAAGIDDSSAAATAGSSQPERASEPAGRSAEPKLIKLVQPEYPQEAQMRGIEGWVDISLQVTAAGDVIAPRVEETSRGRVFNRAALVAVQQWKYQPRSEDAPTEQVRVRLRFQQSN